MTEVIKNVLIAIAKENNKILSNDSLSILIPYSYVLLFSIILVSLGLTLLLIIVLTDKYKDKQNYALMIIMMGISLNIASFMFYVTVCLPLLGI